TLYFAIKGDSNPQPDAVPGKFPVINQVLKNQTVTWSSFYTNETNPTTNIVASYFPGELVLHGKVIFRIPTLGWIFVPFNSPISEPFGLLPISMFSLFVIFFIVIGIGSFFSILSVANKELKKFLAYLSYSKVNMKRPITIKLRNFYQLISIPFILFIFAIFSITPTPLVINDETNLESTNMDQGILELSYNKTLTLDSIVAKHLNNSKIFITINETASELIVNYTETFTAISESIDPSLSFNITGSKNYLLVVNKSNMYILSSNNESYPNLNKYFNFALPESSFNKTNPIGVMTSNVFLKAENGSFNNFESINSKLNYSFIQDLIQVDWQIQAKYNRSNGILLYMKIAQTESLWVVPEVLGMLTIWSFIIIYYELLRRNIQKVFDKKQEAIIKSQPAQADKLNLHQLNQKTDFRLEKYPDPETKSGKNVSEEPDSTTANEIDLKNGKKLSWEEYQKLEEKD
ncbi:MAG: hypothetical protein ACC656_09045, partial [Candidatus Heimdallarchaeota archaeon]